MLDGSGALGKVLVAAGGSRGECGGESRVFRLAATFVLAHVLLDAFVLREPGVDAGAHLLSGLVQAAIVVVGIASYTRLPSPAGAVASVMLGVVALVRGVVAVVDVTNGGRSASSSWSALPLVPVGATLVLVGGVAVWRSRKHGRWRWVRRVAVGIVAALAAYWILVPVSVAIVATEKPRSAVVGADLGRTYEEVELLTADGLRLRGWYVPSRNGAAVIAFPGRSGPVAHARLLVEHGYGVLLLDMRGQGESDGDANAFGWGSRRDIDAALAYLAARPDVEDGRIGGLGLSVGGEVLIEAAAENPALRAVVSEGAGERSLRETLLLGARGWLAVPAAAVQTAAVWLLSGEQVPPALDRAAAGLTPRPLLLVYGQHGQAAERDLNPRYYEAAREPKAIWMVHDAHHTGGLEAQPAQYEERVMGFFEEALRVPRVSPRDRH